MSKIKPLHDKAKASGGVRIIVTISQPQLPDRTTMASDQFDNMLRNASQRVQDRVLARLKPDRLLKVPKRFKFSPQFVAQVTPEGLGELAQDPDVIAIQEDVVEFPLLEESVPHIFPSHDISPYSGNGWAVAVLDSGVDKYHSFLKGKVVSEACYSTNNSLATSLCPGEVSSSTATNSALHCSVSINGCEHGTHVAGIVAGSGESLDGVARSAELIAFQVYSRFDSASICGSSSPCIGSYPSDQISALQRVYELRNLYNIASVNISIGGAYYTNFCDDDSRKTTIDLLKSVGIATVIASGNDGYVGGVSTPGCISTAITVAATYKTVDTPAWFSNSGTQLDFYAPGVSIYSSTPGEGYLTLNGTSVAAPHVAGAWAVLREKFPSDTVDQVETRFDNTGVAVESNGISRQRIDIDEALASSPGGGGAFVSIVPCRIVDTRIAGGMVTANSTRDYKVYGTASEIQAQGGADNCGVSWMSKAVALNITSTQSIDTGHFRIFPYDSSLPNAAILNVTSGQTIGNATISKICQPACLNDISVYSTIDSHVVIDVVGYME